MRGGLIVPPYFGSVNAKPVLAVLAVHGPLKAAVRGCARLRAGHACGLAAGMSIDTSSVRPGHSSVLLGLDRLEEFCGDSEILESA